MQDGDFARARISGRKVRTKLNLMRVSLKASTKPVSITRNWLSNPPKHRISRFSESETLGEMKAIELDKLRIRLHSAAGFSRLPEPPAAAIFAAFVSCTMPEGGHQI